jgi:acyl carrier protein
MDTLGIIIDYINDHVSVPPENITLDSRLDEIGVDSLCLLELMFELEEKYNVRLPDNTQKPETIGHLIALLEAQNPTPTNE